MNTILLMRCSPSAHSGPQIAAHQLVHALEDHLAIGAIHVKHALVAQHARAVHLHDGAQEVFELGGVEGAGGTVDKALHVIVMVVVMALPFVAMVVSGLCSCWCDGWSQCSPCS